MNLQVSPISFRSGNLFTKPSLGNRSFDKPNFGTHYLNINTAIELVEGGFSGFKPNKLIKRICEDNGIPCVLNCAIIKDLFEPHLKATQKVCLNLAKQLGLSSKDTKLLSLAALTHDFGKAFIPDIILNKPGILTVPERQVVGLHSLFGVEMLKGLNCFDDRVLDAVGAHHFPFKPLALPNPMVRLPVTAVDDYVKPSFLTQIISVADEFTALTVRRPYRDALPYQSAVDIIDKGAASGRLNPQIVYVVKENLYTMLAA